MGVPTVLTSWADGLPTFRTRASSDTNPEQKRLAALKAAIAGVGWTNEDEDTEWVIFSNTPLNDAPMFLRVQSAASSGFGSTVSTLTLIRPRSVWLRSFASLADAQSESNVKQQNIWQTSHAANQGNGEADEQSYFIAGDARFFYFFCGVPSTLFSSLVSGFSQLFFLTSQWAGELPRLPGSPACSAVHGSSISTSVAVSTTSRYSDNFWDTGAINPGINNAITGGGYIQARMFSGGDNPTALGIRTGTQLTTPLLSPVFVREATGSNQPRAMLPGIMDTSLNFAVNPPEGLVTTSFTTPLGVRSGLMVPIAASWNATSSVGGFYLDTQSNWDDYHGA